MSLDHNRIKVADLEKNLPNKILITNIEGELAFSDLDSLELDFQQVTDNGYVTENPFYRWYDYGETRGALGILDFPGIHPQEMLRTVVGVSNAGSNSDDPLSDSFILGFDGDDRYEDRYPSIAFRINNYSSYPNINLRFQLPLKDNPSYPAPDRYTLATTDDLTNLNLDFQQVTDNGFVTNNSFYKEHDYGEGRVWLGVVDNSIGVKASGADIESDTDYAFLGFNGYNYNGVEMPSIVFRTKNYGSPSVNTNLRFEFPLKDNPSYPDGDTYTLATDDNVVHKTGEVNEVIDGYKTFRFPTTFRGDASASFITIRSSDLTFTTDVNDNNSIKIKPQKISGAENENYTQTLQAKEGIVALIDDITLQKVVDNAAYATKEYSSIELLSGTDVNIHNNFSVSTMEGDSSIQQDGGEISLTANGYDGQSKGSVKVTKDGVVFTKVTPLDSYSESTGTFSLPSGHGDYILATTTDLDNLTLQTVTDNGNSTTNNIGVFTETGEAGHFETNTGTGVYGNAQNGFAGVAGEGYGSAYGGYFYSNENTAGYFESNTGKGIEVSSISDGAGIFQNNNDFTTVQIRNDGGEGQALQIYNSGPSVTCEIVGDTADTVLEVNSFSGINAVFNQSSTSDIIVGNRLGSEVFSVDYQGNTTAKSFIKEGGNSSQYLMADGSVSSAMSEVSGTASGIVNNTSLQELGGVDKTINGVRIGKGNNNFENNLVIGRNGLASITTGQYNVAIGNGDGVSEGGLQFTTTGSDNTMVGSDAGVENTTGNGNTGIGSGALFKNTSGTYNTAVGASTLGKTTTATANTAMGYVAAYSLNGGNNNTAIGYTSQVYNVGGSNNTTMGSGAGYYITGSGNTSIGFASQQFNATGNYNTSLGYQAGGSITNGSGNIMIGTQTSVNNGGFTGSNNLIICPSYGALNATGITTGSGNVVLGKASGLSASLTNNIILADGVGNIRTQHDGTMWTMGTPVKSTQFRLSVLNTAPTSSTDTGVLGEIRITATYIYVCTATNTWVRTALTTW